MEDPWSGDPVRLAQHPAVWSTIAWYCANKKSETNQWFAQVIVFSGAKSRSSSTTSIAPGCRLIASLLHILGPFPCLCLKRGARGSKSLGSAGVRKHSYKWLGINFTRKSSECPCCETGHWTGLDPKESGASPLFPPSGLTGHRGQVFWTPCFHRHCTREDGLAKRSYLS